jgi:nicotinate-nucleotide adenylyltransferase
MNIAIMGGTFNPIHFGHLFLAEEIRHAFQFDKILIIPTYRPAHKEVAGGIDPKDRLRMCERAVRGYGCFQVDDCEIVRGGISYMIDTLEEVNSRYKPDGRIGLVMGDDLIPAFSQWKKAPELARRARIIIVHRLSASRQPAPFPHEYFENKVIPLSSSEIRERIRTGLPVRFLIPESVYDYIEEKSLYKK